MRSEPARKPRQTANQANARARRLRNRETKEAALKEAAEREGLTVAEYKAREFQRAEEIRSKPRVVEQPRPHPHRNWYD